MQKDFVRKHATPAPRYTSYPTAPHFHAGIDSNTYAHWLRHLDPKHKLSLYIHIPWCDRLCWFCGCTTKQTRKYQPLKTYLRALENEMDTIASLVDRDCRVSALHLGGGSPTLLAPQDMIALDTLLRSRFQFEPDAEISVEMDPNDLNDEKYDALAQIGLTRASIGVQDFDETVQKAINRPQSYEQTREVVEQLRARGVRSLNCDVLYGLPYQTRQTIDKTIEQVLMMAPDRIALFGYAHVPWIKPHQKMISDESLPDITERFAQMNRASSTLTAAGYTAIGIDHFALPGDSLAIAAASGTLRRNFQGYTSDNADALIGMGASSIGHFPQGYIQNQPSTGEYQRRANLGELPVIRGFELSTEDRIRARIIELLMCDFGFSFAALRREFGKNAESILDDAEILAKNEADGMVELKGGLFQITTKGRPFVRLVAAAFDSYLGEGSARHSLAV